MELRSGQRFRVTRGSDGVRVDVLPMRDQHAWVASGMGMFCLVFGLLLLSRGDGRPAPLQEPWRIQGVGTVTLLAGAALVVAGEMRARRTARFEARPDRLSVPGLGSWARTDVAKIEARHTGETRVENFSKTPVAGLYVHSSDGRQTPLATCTDAAALDWLARVLMGAIHGRPRGNGCDLCGLENASADCPDCRAWAPRP